MRLAVLSQRDGLGFGATRKAWHRERARLRVRSVSPRSGRQHKAWRCFQPAEEASAFPPTRDSIADCSLLTAHCLLIRSFVRYSHSRSQNLRPNADFQDLRVWIFIAYSCYLVGAVVFNDRLSRAVSPETVP
jgi:hypothetical protein